MNAMKRIGVQQLAQLANVSIGTVDRALHNRGRIGKATRERVLQVARQVGYRPNLAARALTRPTVRIGVCVPREIHFFYDQIREGLESEAQRFEHIGLDLVYRPVDRLGAGEAERVRALLSDKIQALIVTPGDPRRIGPLLDEAEAHGIRVICVASDAPSTHRSTVICVQPDLNGRMAGELMGRFVSPRSQVAVITGMARTEDHRKKVNGFKEAFPRFCPAGRIVEVLEGHEDEDETFLKCQGLLKNHRALGGIYVTTVNCLPVCRALSAHQSRQKISLIVTDLFREMVPYFKKGIITASMHQRPYRQGQIAIRLIVDHLVNDRPLPPNYYLNPSLAILSNLGQFRELREPRSAAVASDVFRVV
jgi:LacI family transcriptional regulator